MKIYEIIARMLNCEGNFRCYERIALFMDQQRAQEFVESWQAQWDKHSTVGDPAYGHGPCCLECDRELTIQEVETND